MQPRLLYAIYFLVAVASSYGLSELGLLVTLLTVGLLVGAMLVWKRKRPQDFLIANHMPRIFISLMWAFVFFVGYLIVRKVQPTNYRAYNLASCVGDLVFCNGLLTLDPKTLEEQPW